MDGGNDVAFYGFGTSASSNSPFVELLSGDDVFVAAGVTLAAPQGGAISTYRNYSDPNPSINGGHRAIIDGNVIAGYTAIYLGNFATDFGEELIVRKSGQVMGGYGAILYGSGSRVENAGYIYGESDAIRLNTSVEASPYTVARILNTGTLESPRAAIERGSVSETERLEITNTGLIKSDGMAFGSAGAVAVDSFINKGTVIGYIMLDGGKDLYDGRAGKITGSVYGGDGQDTLYGGTEKSTMSGGTGADTIDGGAGNDYLSGDENSDSIKGGTGNDTLYGGTSNDTLSGGDGDDKLSGDLGKDRLVGGTGDDQFYFWSQPSSANVDTITDFKPGEDKITLYGTTFGALGTSVTSSEFGAKSSGHVAGNNQHIIYDKSNGTLWYDADDNGSGAAIQFATLSTKPQDLSYADFQIV